MLTRLLSVLGSIASLFGCVFLFRSPDSPLTLWQAIFFGLAVLLSVWAIATEVRSYWQGEPRKFRTKKSIRDYMYNWISNGGKVCIFSNDLSWVDDDEMKQMLHRKAAANELTILLPTPIPLSEELKRDGAHVVTYAPLGITPKSRFTLVNSGRDGAQVAIGRRIGNVHCIEEFAEGSHPVFAIASDLVELLNQYSAKRRTTDQLESK